LIWIGVDFDLSSTPLEVGLEHEISWEPANRDFIGRKKLEQQKKDGVAKQLIGIKLDDKGVLRHGQHVYIGKEEKGLITSGTFSPTLQRSIALVRVDAPPEQMYTVDIRDKMKEAYVVRLPFVKLNRSSL